jgi:hypothetical protein
MKPRLFSTLRALQHENPLVGFSYTCITWNIITDTDIRDYHAQEASRACNAVFLSGGE